MRTASDQLSYRQERILSYIQDFIHENGYSPSIRDIQESLSISSTSVVAYNLKALQEKGRLAREGKISRGIRLPNHPKNASAGKHTSINIASVQIPLLGVITAGEPLPNPEDTSASEREMIDVPPEIAPQKLDNIYALKVRGYSMIDALIDDGDIVLMQYQETADNGQMVAVRLINNDNAVTLKKFYHEEGRIRLQPANVTMEPIYTTPDNVAIQGRVVGVLRSLA